MSGITPILDTLLHQVLGKRVDIPVLKDLNPPVGPAVHPEGPRAVRADARLDSRQPAVLEPPPMSRQPSSASARDLPPGAEAGATSASTRLSPVAQIIAGLLARFPSPPSVIQPPAPLLPAQDAAPASLVASRLQASIRDSGLFYESHLANWYRGATPRQQLEREPQMRMPPPAPPSAAGAATPAPVGASVTPPPAPPSATAAALIAAPLSGTSAQATALQTSAAQAGAPQNRLPQTSPLQSATPQGSTPPTNTPLAGQNPWIAERAQAHTFHTTDDDAPSQPAGRALDIAEGLQGVVRHQLELLAAPVLRWEGDLWSGIFVALVIQAPDAFRDQHQEPDADRDDGEEEGAWQSELTVHIEDFGPLRVHLRLAGTSLSLGIAVASTAVLERLEAGRSTLLSRLETRGFSEPAIDIRLDRDNNDGRWQ